MIKNRLFLRKIGVIDGSKLLAVKLSCIYFSEKINTNEWWLYVTDSYMITASLFKIDILVNYFI